MIQIFTKQKYVRRIGSGGAFGVMMGGEGGDGLYLGQRGLFCHRGPHLTNDGGFLHF